MRENRKCPFCGEKMICVNTQDGEFTCTSCAEYANHDVLDFIENLKAENERLKAENAELIERAKWNAREQRAHNENMRNKIAKLKCLALHLFERVAFHEFNELCEISSEVSRVEKNRDRWYRIYTRCGCDYRKAKKELRKGK